MTASEILERINQRQSQAFAMQTTGGNWIFVDRKTRVVVDDHEEPIKFMLFCDNGTYLVEPHDIAVLEVIPPKKSWWRRLFKL